MCIRDRVRGFVDQSGGNLDLISEVGVGTTVKLTFPAVQQQEVSNEKMVESGFTAAESRHILVVDDNEQLLSLISEKLRREGFKITTQPSGDAALDALKQGVQPDLVLSDVVMPGKIQGRELARYVHNLYPKTPVILMSGYADPDEDLGLANLEADDFLQKPVQLAEMVDRIRRLLG